LKTQVEKLPELIGIGDWVTAKDTVLQNTGERPMHAAISRVSPAGLPEVGCNTVELSPGDCHLAAVCRVNGDGALVRGIPQDVIPTCIDVYLKARKQTELRDHSRRSLYRSRSRRRIIVRFKWHISWRPCRGRQLSRSAGERDE